MMARLSDYFRRLLSEWFHSAMHLAGFPTTGGVPFGHPLHATPL